MKAMLKVKNNETQVSGYAVFDIEKAKALAEYVKEIAPHEAVEMYEVGKMPLEALPLEIQEKVKSILKAFSNVNVVYEYGEFRASTSITVKSRYSDDHFVCGYYAADEVYTKEERRQNFIDEFGYAPCYL